MENSDQIFDYNLTFENGHAEVMQLTASEAGFLRLTIFFDDQESGRGGVQTNPHELKVMRDAAAETIKILAVFNKVVADAVANGNNIFYELNTFWQKLIILQLARLKLIKRDKQKYVINYNCLNFFKGCEFPINIFFVPKQIITSGDTGLIIDIFTKCQDPLNFLNHFYDEYISLVHQK